MVYFAQVLINKCIIYKNGLNSNGFDGDRSSRGMGEIYFNRQFTINSAAGMGLAMPYP
jgi:hypothetical protein